MVINHIETMPLMVCLLLLLEMGTQACNMVPITLVESAVQKGAVCLDGSPPAYYYDKGLGEGANNWVVYLLGGAWCYNENDCIERANNRLGSSFKMDSVKNFQGLLSPNQTENPDFYNWNRVFVGYCDGGSFAGDVEQVNPKTALHYRGARVFNAVVEDLLAKGMKYANNVILSGHSAGGLATIIHCDRFRAQVPNAHRLKCISDGGYMIYGKDIPGATEFTIESPYHNAVELHGIDKFLPKSCTSKMDAKLCMYPENLVADIETPLFIVNSAFDSYQLPIKVNNDMMFLGACKFDATLCTPAQIKIMQGFRTSFLKALPKGDCRRRGIFIDSLNTHDHINYDAHRWTGPKAPQLNNKTLAEAFADWYFDRGCFQEIDPRDVPQNNVK